MAVGEHHLQNLASALGGHPAVSEAAVVRKGDRLVAYVVLDKETISRDDIREWQESRVDLWRAVWDRAYVVDDDQFNEASYTSSYTGEPIPAVEVREWLDGTVDQLARLGAKSVLEIGCGMGLLVFRIAPTVERYCALDFSEEALAYVRSKLDGRANVTLLQRSADDLDGVEPVDLVVVNSVIQYFPDVDYLLTVVRGAVDRIAPGGRMYIGDVRSLPLLPAFAASVETFRATSDVDPDELRARIAERIARDSELVIDPGFFRALHRLIPRITHVEISLRRGRAQNELTRFRYDVILHLDRTGSSHTAPTFEWTSMAWIVSYVAEQPAAFVVTGIPNARIGDGIEPADLWENKAFAAYDIDLTWSASLGAFDARFTRHGVERDLGAVADGPVPTLAELRALANNPLSGLMETHIGPELGRYLTEKFPGTALPDFVVVAKLP